MFRLATKILIPENDKFVKTTAPLIKRKLKKQKKKELSTNIRKHHFDRVENY